MITVNILIGWQKAQVCLTFLNYSSTPWQDVSAEARNIYVVLHDQPS